VVNGTSAKVKSLALAIALALLGCQERTAPVDGARSAGLVDLGTSLEAIRADFEAHRGEKRFLTLLAPT
jgi:hypothetical protein